MAYPCSSLLSFRFSAARDDFPNGLASLALWGRLITCAPIVNRCRRATPGPDRVHHVFGCGHRPRLVHPWPKFFLRTFSSASLACPRARAERDMKGTAPWILEFASMPGVRVAPRRRKPERAKERSPRREPCGNRTLLLAAPERGGRAPAGTSYAPFRGYPLRRHSRRLTPRATFLCSSGVPLAPNAARE